MKHTRVINTVIHDLTAAQVLETILRLFSESRKEPVYLATLIGSGDKTIKQVRVELSRLRKQAKESGLAFPYFGFVDTLQPIRTREHGITFEYHEIKFRLTPSQHFKTQLANMPELTS